MFNFLGTIFQGVGLNVWSPIYKTKHGRKAMKFPPERGDTWLQKDTSERVKCYYFGIYDLLYYKNMLRYLASHVFFNTFVKTCKARQDCVEYNDDEEGELS